jgi:hypothetical protein
MRAKLWVRSFLILTTATGLAATLWLLAAERAPGHAARLKSANASTLTAGAAPGKVFLPLIARSSLIFADDFSDPGSGWPSFDDEWGKGGYLNGEYQLLARVPESNAFATPDLVLPANYRLEVDARQAPGMAGSYVVMFGTLWSSNTYETLQFVVYPASQEYLLEKRSPDGTWTILIDWTYHPAIGAWTATNRLAVERSGTAIRLYANGTLLATTVEPGYTSPGRDGGVRAYSYDDAPVDMRFDNFSAYELP